MNLRVSGRRLAVVLAWDASAAMVLAFEPGQQSQPPRPAIAQVSPEEATRELNDPRSRWFREAKFGLFIHWGLYAIPAGTWKGQQIPGIGEWIMNRAKIPVKEYEQLAAALNHLFQWPGGRFDLGGVKHEVKKAYLLAASGTRLKANQEGETVSVPLPAQAPEQVDSVLVLEY